MVIKTLGLVIFIVGTLFTLYSGFNPVINRKMDDKGRVLINEEKEASTNWLPFMGLGTMTIGGVVIYTGNKRNSRTRKK